MEQQQNSVKDRKEGSQWWDLIRKHGFTFILGIFALMLFVNPDFKSWTLRQLMHTGLFNTSIEEKAEREAPLVKEPLDFAFEDEAGNILHLSSLKGKVVFINFWASWCPPCRAEFPSIETLYSRFEHHPDLFFLLLNEDRNRTAALNYLSKEGYDFPLFRTWGPVPHEIYTGTLPTTIVLDKDGQIRMRHTGIANYGSSKFLKQMEWLVRE